MNIYFDIAISIRSKDYKLVIIHHTTFNFT
jgi:hypothetical protein